MTVLRQGTDDVRTVMADTRSVVLLWVHRVTHSAISLIDDGELSARRAQDVFDKLSALVASLESEHPKIPSE